MYMSLRSSSGSGHGSGHGTIKRKRPSSEFDDLHMGNPSILKSPIKKISHPDSDSDTNSDELCSESSTGASNSSNPFKRLLSEPKNENVYNEGSHIYFRDSVNKYSIDTLIKIINKLNKKYTNAITQIDFATIQPLPIILHITSGGGNCLMGFLAADYIKNSKIPIYTIVEGYAFSAATFMSIVGKKRFITENSMVLIHQISSTMSGHYTHENLKDEIFNGEIIMKKLCKLYLTNTHGKLKQKTIDQMLKQDLYLDAKKSIQLGLVDSIYKNTSSFDD